MSQLREKNFQDPDNFGSIVCKYQDMAYATALSALGHVQMAEDAAQEAFVEAYVGIKSLRAPEAFTSWFRVILARSIARVRSRQWYGQSHLSEDQAVVGDPTRNADLRIDVAHALNTLPSPQRTAAILYYLGGYSTAEVAEQTGVPLTTVKKRLHDARRKLRTRMEHLMEDTIKQAAPSADNRFATNVLRLIQPDELKSDSFVAWSGGIGTEVWSIFRAAMTGDIDAVRGLLAKDPNLVRGSYQYRTPLHFAVRENHPEIVRLLLGAGADAADFVGHDRPLQIAQDRGYDAVAAILSEHLASEHGVDPRSAPIVTAIRGRDLDGVSALLDREPDLLGCADERGNLPIHWAALTRNLGLIDLLLERGADINARRPDGARPLDLTGGDYWFRARRDLSPNAIKSPDVIAGHLLARGADYSLPNAATFGDVERVRELLDAGHSPGRDPNAYCTYYSGSPLRNAAAEGRLEVVQLLLERGADPDEPEPGICPFGGALYAAAAAGKHEVARLLLEQGASPNQTMESSGSAMSRAQGNKDDEMVVLLASYGGITGFAISVYYGDVETVAAMISANPALAADPEAFGYAVSEGHTALVRLLLKNAAGVVHKITADQAKTAEMLTLLLDSGLDPNASNWLGITALHRLAAAGAVDRATILLDRGAQIDPIDEEYRSTPLGWAARTGKTEMAAFLLERGAALQPAGQPAWAAPVAWAERRGHVDLQRLFAAHASA